MYHTKEVLCFNEPITNLKSNHQPVREGVKLAPIRFGELGVGSQFVYGGCWLVKTGEYAAESDNKRGKIYYLFFKKDLVSGIKTISKDPQPQYTIVFFPGEKSHRVEVRGDDGYHWENTFKGNLSEYWAIPLLIKNIEFDLIYDGEDLCLCFKGDVVGSKKIPKWTEINTCTIYIKNFCLELDNT